jgi:4-amino-4-deoxy-L-arabinose transferase-like glycosyltransferase
VQRINPYLLLMLISLVLFVPGITSLPVVDRDEAHFSQATRQMVQTGEYFQIRFQEKTRFQKPPGINWLQAGVVNTFTDGDASKIWPYRIPSVIGGILSVLFLFFFARRFVSERSALLGSAFLASSLLLVIESHMAIIDSSLLSAVVLMQGALWFIYDAGISGKKVHKGWALLFWAAMAYGFVLKGVTPLVGVLSVITLCVIDRNIKWLKGLHVFLGIILFIGLGLSWLLLVNAAENSNYLLQMVHKDLLPKLQGGHESHGQPPLFHLAILPLTLWPASLFLWQGGVFAFKKRHLRTVKFLLAWVLPTWLFFEIMPTKLPQYVLPTFPAICLLLAMAIEPSESDEKPSKTLHVLQILWGVLTFCMALGALFLPYIMMQQFTFSAIFIFWILSVIGFCSIYFAWKANYTLASRGTILIALLAFPLMFAYLLPQVRPLWVSKHVAKHVEKEQVSKQQPLLSVGYSEPSLVFYFNTDTVVFTDVSTGFKQIENNPGQLMIIDQETFATVPNHRDYNIQSRIPGFNYSKGKWLKLLVIEHNP